MAALSRRYIPQTIAVPAGTAQAAPVVTKVPMGGTVKWERLEVLIPPGHAGTTGIAFLLSGQGVIPWAQPLAFIVGDDQDLFFDVGLEVDGDIEVRSFNTDAVVHSFFLRFQVSDPPPRGAGAGVELLPITAGV